MLARQGDNARTQRLFTLTLFRFVTMPWFCRFQARQKPVNYFHCTQKGTRSGAYKLLALLAAPLNHFFTVPFRTANMALAPVDEPIVVIIYYLFWTGQFAFRRVNRARVQTWNSVTRTPGPDYLGPGVHGAYDPVCLVAAPRLNCVFTAFAVRLHLRLGEQLVLYQAVRGI